MESAGVDKAKVKIVINGILKACEEVAIAIRDIDCAVGVMQNNAFGDNQLHIDVLGDKHIFDHLRETKLVAFGLSEETPEPQECGGSDFIVTFDPLDGSSIVDCNWTVGTIFAIWPNKDKLQGLTGHDIITAGIVCYGPRTTVVYYDLEDGNVNEYKLHLKAPEDSDSKWIKMKTKMTIGPSNKMFAPGNFRASSESKAYSAMMDYWKSSKYTLRCIGSMASDCYALFIKSGGIFCALASKSCPAKLRVLYECQPIAFVVEKAGGMSTDGKRSILDIKIDGFQQKTPFACGSTDEIERIKKAVAEEERATSEAGSQVKASVDAK